MATIIDVFGDSLMAPVADPWTPYRRLRREQPVLRLRGPFGDEHLVTRYDDVAGILRDSETFSSKANAKAIGLVLGRTLLEMEGREHVRHRHLIGPFFSRRALLARQSMIAAIAHHLIDTFVKRGEADLVKEFTFTFPLRVLVGILGLPMDDYATFHRQALDLISVGDDPPRGLAAAAWIDTYLRPILAERRRRPADDLVSALAHGEVDGRALADDEVISFLKLLLPAGAETTYRLIGSALFALLTHPDALDGVLADRGVIDALLQETLRWESPVQFVSRETTKDVELSGFRIGCGELLFVSLGSANRDERHYEDPDRFDIERMADDQLAFGLGSHYCAGAQLALLESTVALNSLLDRLPGLRLRCDEAAEIVGVAFRSPNRLPVAFDA